MARAMMYCNVCNNYTLKSVCCEKSTISKVPPKYSPDDKYAGMRKNIKREEWQA